MFELLHVQIGTLPVSLVFPSNSKLNTFNYQVVALPAQRSTPKCCLQWAENLLHAKTSTGAPCPWGFAEGIIQFQLTRVTTR
jgi:hypothetical protein